MHFGGDDDLGGLAVSHFFHSFHAAQGKHVLAGGGFVDQADRVRFGFLHHQQGLGFAFSFPDALLLYGFGAQDGAFLFAFGAGDGCLLFTFRQQDGSALFTVGLHLLFHGLADLCRGLNIFQLHAIYLNAPAVGRFVQAGGNLGVDQIAAGQRFVQGHRADDIAQRGSRKVLDGLDGAVDTVSKQLGIKHLEEHNGIDHHRNVVTGDNGLRGEVCGFFFQADLAGHTLHKGSAQVQAGTPGILIHAKPLGNIGVGLGHNDNAAGDADQHKDQQDSNNQ